MWFGSSTSTLYLRGSKVPQRLGNSRSYLFECRGSSGINKAPASAKVTAPIMYQAGATGLPVQRISNVSTSWVVPPKIAIASA